MMYKAFQEYFTLDADIPSASENEFQGSDIAGWSVLIERFGGKSFGNGLYRIIRFDDVEIWSERLAIAFPEFGGRATCFGFDWLGRLFAVDKKRLVGGQPGVILMEPGTGEVLEVPCDICAFHNEEIIKYGDAALAASFYAQWLSSGGGAPTYTQCVGYRTPLFLGGEDEIGNLEIADVDVYWHIMTQLIEKTRSLPPGTNVYIGR